MQALGEASPIVAVAATVCSALWQGHVGDARAILESGAAEHLPAAYLALFDLIAQALSGPPWPLDLMPETTGTLTYPIRALVHYLRGETEAGDHLLSERYADRVAAAGHAFQRFTPFYPGPLVSALGPAGTEPDLDWLCNWVFDPPLPGLWPVNRAMSAVLLGERGHPMASQLASRAIQIVTATQPDVAVATWITERARTVIRTA
jgi:hypothetical protein